MLTHANMHHLGWKNSAEYFPKFLDTTIAEDPENTLHKHEITKMVRHVAKERLMTSP